ncbi:unnamed protein product [Orchesella dallaii]|uniref:Uncharacterized protein n=1 Tax=Orchesella dallaii TaxID=48710 RepID=A0ABP1RP85_9HEXA
MNDNTNFQQQLQYPYQYLPYPPSPPGWNDMNPFGARPQSPIPPSFSNYYPDSASNQASCNLSTIPVGPTACRCISQEVYQAVLNKNQMYLNQITNLEKKNTDHKKQISDLRANLLESNKTIKGLEFQLIDVKADASKCRNEKSIAEIKCDNLISEKIALHKKMKTLKNEDKSELQAEKDANKKLSCKVISVQKTVLQLKKTLECQSSSHKKELDIQQQEFNRKVEDCSEAVDNEIRQYKSLWRKMHLLKKENLDIQEQMNKTKQENSNLMSKLETQKETSQCKCAKKAEDLRKIIRQQQPSKDSPAQPTVKREMSHTMS